MCRVVVNPSDLAETAALIENAAGEYEAIGARVAGCNCGCMPGDVAAVVDAVTADVRGSLAGVAGSLSEQAAGLAWRAGVDQYSGFNGEGQTVTIGGGFYTPVVAEDVATAPVSVNIGSGLYSPVVVGGGGGGQTVTIGGGFYAPMPDYGNTVEGQTVTIGSRSGGMTVDAEGRPLGTTIGTLPYPELNDALLIRAVAPFGTPTPLLGEVQGDFLDGPDPPWRNGW
jgi:hypothetical protein